MGSLSPGIIRAIREVAVDIVKRETIGFVKGKVNEQVLENFMYMRSVS
jgi:hypothetical protein